VGAPPLALLAGARHGGAVRGARLGHLGGGGAARRRAGAVRVAGPVTVSLLGTGGGRTHTVIGDTVNTASRIEGKAPAGGVAVGPGTKARIPQARTAPLGPLELKVKAEPVEAHLLISLG
jgi:class 3 adenylate cyclase